MRKVAVGTLSCGRADVERRMSPAPDISHHGEVSSLIQGKAMRFREAGSRITGISVPLFGIQWTPPEAERAIARRVLTFLEDRRVLYVPSEMEVPQHGVQSVLRIREFLTSELGHLTGDGQLAQSLRAMRAACRKFLDSVGPEDGPVVRHAFDHGHYASWEFNQALGEMRGVFGIYIAILAATHGLDVEPGLARIVPGSDKDDHHKAGDS